MTDRMDSIQYARRNKLGVSEDDLNWMTGEIARLRQLVRDLEGAVVQNARATRAMEKRLVEAETRALGRLRGRCKPAGVVR